MDPLTGSIRVVSFDGIEESEESLDFETVGDRVYMHATRVAAKPPKGSRRRKVRLTAAQEWYARLITQLEAWKVGPADAPSTERVDIALRFAEPYVLEELVTVDSKRGKKLCVMIKTMIREVLEG